MLSAREEPTVGCCPNNISAMESAHSSYVITSSYKPLHNKYFSQLQNKTDTCKVGYLLLFDSINDFSFQKSGCISEP